MDDLPTSSPTGTSRPSTFARNSRSFSRIFSDVSSDSVVPKEITFHPSPFRGQPLPRRRRGDESLIERLMRWVVNVVACKRMEPPHVGCYKLLRAQPLRSCLSPRRNEGCEE